MEELKEKIKDRVYDDVIIKWADSIGLPSGYDEDLDKLYKMLILFLNAL